MKDIDEMRELRLMKGQEGYRFCMQWLLVFVKRCRWPTCLAMVIWLATSQGSSTKVSDALLSLTPLIVRAMGK
jgi:hypothetical protein